MPGNDSTQLIVALVNSVRDDLRSDIADVRQEVAELKQKKPQLFDWKHYVIFIALVFSLAFNLGSESQKIDLSRTVDSSAYLHTAKAAASSTYTDIAKAYKLTNGNAAGN